jgi:predicted Abi (CAAX) family protease
MPQWVRYRWSDRRFKLLATLTLTVSLLLLWATATPALEAQYRITGRAGFNQIDHYPLRQTLPSDRYRPTGTWVGRLILPPVAQGSTADWVWMEVDHAPESARDLQGQKIRLEWSPTPAVQQYVAAVTRDVKFTDAVAASQRQGNLHPDRLNGRSQVGPLQSLAGARPIDDVWVTLDEATVVRQLGRPTRLQIDSDPVLETGRLYGLVKILASVPTTRREFIPTDCPGPKPCPSELFQVQHYNAATGQFDGVTETIRIPQQPRDSIGVFASTPRDIEKSPAGVAGWYIYGAQDQTGLFTVQALKPRALVQLHPQRTLTDPAQGLDYINYGHWQNTEQRRGTLETVLIDPQGTERQRPIAWSAGQHALVMHLFGGRGGQHGEAPALGTVTGHFSYGLATVVQEPLANELQWEVRYQQVYATNVEGFISGTNAWTAYMGDLRRGWLGTRPVSDILVKLDVIEDYDFGGQRIAPLQELQRQLQVINARYRSGDGSGAAVVTPATSCVQDSNQALFATVQQVRYRVANSLAIQSWLAAHPQDPTTERFRRLIRFGDEVERQLMPLGIVREDWKSNSEALSGTEIRSRTFRRTHDEGTANLLAALTSWRTILPRQTQDELSLLFLKNGAQLWILRTNQVGGSDPEIFPIAPTKAFGRWAIPGTPIAVVAVVLTRLLGAINLPSVTDWGIAIAALLIYGAVALPIGFTQGFLQRQRWPARRAVYLRLALRLFFLPALLEELVFRVLLLPAPPATTWQIWGIWAMGSLCLFVGYHPLRALKFYQGGNPTFCDRRFLTLVALLGGTCTVTYALTSSLLLITLIHWIVVLVWLLSLGGMVRLNRSPQIETP